MWAQSTVPALCSEVTNRTGMRAKRGLCDGLNFDVALPELGKNGLVGKQLPWQSG
jgi:hypothetical protein